MLWGETGDDIGGKRKGRKPMHWNINSPLHVCVADEGFSFDELVTKLDEVFKKKGFPELIRLIMMLVDEVLRVLVMKREPLPAKASCGCDQPSPVLDGCKERKIHTRLGQVEFPCITRAKCRNCGRIWLPLLEFCGLRPGQRHSDELEKLALETCAKETYRDAAGRLRDSPGVHLHHTTYRRWVLKTKAGEIAAPAIGEEEGPWTLWADGTGYKGVDESGHAEAGDLKTLFGIAADGSLQRLGVWTGGKSWADIRSELAEKSIQFPDGSLLISDAEPGLVTGLEGCADDQQRCHWHTVRDLYHAMHKDGASAPEIKPVQKRLKTLLAVELPQEDFDEVPPEKKEAIRRRMETAEEGVDRLVAELETGGYPKAAAYLKRGKHALFAYVRRWLALGMVSPRASSFIERVMRALGKRIKKIGYNWKAEGALKMARIVLKLFASDSEWKAYWKHRMGETSRVVILFRPLQVT